MNDENDSGGFTVAGVTVNNFCEFFGLPKVKDVHNPPADIKAMMRNLTAEHLGLYYKHYKWDVVRCDELPPGVDLMICDIAVLQGPGKAGQFLRECLGGFPPGDSVTEDMTQAAQDYPDWDQLVSNLASLRRAHFLGIVQSKPSQKKWLKGWLNRNARVEAQCLELAPNEHERVAGAWTTITDVARAEAA
jgi:lysozyme family protein